MRSLPVALLLSTYVFMICYDSLHPFFSHDHQAHAHETCSAEMDKNLCHKKVYHHDSNVDCHHGTHLHNPTHDCSLCDALVSISILPKEKISVSQQLIPSNAIVTTEEMLVFKYFHALTNPRGPPSLLS